MDKSNCYRVGRIVKSFGYKGNLILLFDLEDAYTYAPLSCIFVEIEGELVPFFLEDYQIRDDQTALVQFDDLVSEDQAKKLVNHDLYLPLDTLSPEDQSPPLQSWIEGYKVFDQQKRYIGTVEEFIRLKKQDLFKVADRGNEMLIPAVEAYIIRVDKRHREIHLDLPEGLLDLNP
jgi:16S rRNA processing protein RimM